MPTVYFNYATITTGDNVPVNVTKVYEDGGEVHKDLMLSDAALTANAVANGRAVWDNVDIYALVPCEARPVTPPVVTPIDEVPNVLA